jgi:hypothetical protein
MSLSGCRSISGLQFFRYIISQVENRAQIAMRRISAVSIHFNETPLYLKVEIYP